MTKALAKKPGRPATGKDPMIGLRAPPELRKAIEAWASQQEDTPGLSEAIRRLVERGLNAQSIGRGKWWKNRKPVHD
jgi:hypothetical protein